MLTSCVKNDVATILTFSAGEILRAYFLHHLYLVRMKWLWALDATLKYAAKTHDWCSKPVSGVKSKHSSLPRNHAVRWWCHGGCRMFQNCFTLSAECIFPLKYSCINHSNSLHISWKDICYFDPSSECTQPEMYEIKKLSSAKL